MNIAIIKAGIKLFITKYFPNMKLVIYNMITFDSGYNNPQLIIVSGNVISFNAGLIVLFNIYIMIAANNAYIPNPDVFIYNDLNNFDTINSTMA